MRYLALGLFLVAGCAEPKREIGVDVFSNDTTPARFLVTMSGTLVMALRSNNFFMRPDKTLVLETPGSLIVQKGVGDATIASFDSTKKDAVEPIGTRPDSSDLVAVSGRVVRVSVDEKMRVKMKVERP
jgi:hypothetical protein